MSPVFSSDLQPSLMARNDEHQKEFLDLFARHARRVSGYVSALVPNQADADDVFQETCRVLWEKFGEFEPGTDFFAWAAAVVRFQVLAHRQRQRRSRLQFSTEFIETVSRQLIDRSEQLERRHDALAGCLRKLRDRDRELIELRYAPGVTTKEVAQRVNRPIGGVYKALNRIENALIRCVQRTALGES